MAEIPKNDMRRFQLERVLPTLRRLGYDGEPRYTKLQSGSPFQVSVGYNVHDKAFFTGAKAQLYHSDCYPVIGRKRGQDGECALHLWTWTGSPSMGECKKVAAALTADGVPARATTYKKCAVVAFAPGNWLDVACGPVGE